MSRSSQRLCLFCQHRPLTNIASIPHLQSWQSSRSMAQLQRRAPSRMALSPNVARPSEKVAPSGKPVRRRTNSPFGAMNLKSADLRRPPHQRSESQLKRSYAGRDRPQSDREGPGRDRVQREKRTRGSAETFKALKMQRSLSIVSYGQRNAVKEKISGIETFDDFPLLPIVKESVATQALTGLEYIHPTPIQRLSIPALLGDDGKSRRRSRRAKSEAMEQFLLAAETGSGKTLAYVLPVLDAIKRAEVSDADIEAHKTALEEEKRRNSNSLELEAPPLSNQPHPTAGRPRAVILVPTSELVTQVGSVVKALSHKIKFRAALISSAYTGRVIRNRLFSPSGIDVVISTPHLLSSIAESDPNILSRVSHLIVDEADSLLDRSFAPSTSIIIDKSTSSLRQLVLCSATIPRSLDNYVRSRFPDIRRLVTPNLHAIPRHVQLSVVDVEKEPYRGNKNLACADTIWAVGKAAAEHSISHTPGGVGPDRVDVKRILVFVNEREKTLEVADYLMSKGIDAVALNRDTPEERKAETLAEFTSSAPETVSIVTEPKQFQPGEPNYIPATRSSASSPPPRRHLPNTKVLVTTDLGSRGIDTVAVKHVFLYDVPHSTIDFIHRLGRTGRMGRRGRGIVLVGKGDRRDVVREVKEGMFMGQALI